MSTFSLEEAVELQAGVSLLQLSEEKILGHVLQQFFTEQLAKDHIFVKVTEVVADLEMHLFLRYLTFSGGVVDKPKA